MLTVRTAWGIKACANAKHLWSNQTSTLRDATSTLRDALSVQMARKEKSFAGEDPE